jgi:hypothetical protein
VSSIQRYFGSVAVFHPLSGGTTDAKIEVDYFVGRGAWDSGNMVTGP